MELDNNSIDPLKSTDPRALAIAEWAEGKATPPAPRHPAGAAGHITPDERREIQLVHLTEGLNKSQLATRFGRTRESIAGCLGGEEFEKLQAEVWEQLKAEAFQGLRGHVVPAVKGWGNAIGIAAAAGNHKPAKDLLEATGVIEREQGSRLGFQINIGIPGHPVGPDPLAALGVAVISEVPSK